jgi:uncharacterized protein (TIGR02466 family)
MSTRRTTSPDQRRVEALFPTLVYRAEISGPSRLNHELEAVALNLAEHDSAGRRWCLHHAYAGYTSYRSIDNLAERSQGFARLARIVEQHATRFAKMLHWDLRGGWPIVDSMWVNVLPGGGSHTSHLHTNAVLSGTYYVTTPEGAAAIAFEDPRHPLMMAAPPRTAKAPREMQTYVTLLPSPGTLLIWESWLRHEVPLNRSASERISVSFNCVIG